LDRELAEPVEDSGREGISDRMKEIRACRAKMRVPEMLDMIEEANANVEKGLEGLYGPTDTAIEDTVD
jgi:hypothetical protein